ncbi:helix-turn-helix transcriptional regulator [Sphaerisporangium sp. B11E5]|uniref:helix-turn-helix domain-containing protein n=1 Tax=Sphaerisporangium sp. B11E5 TaxID=3153563 RepID=UPI00325CD911
MSDLDPCLTPAQRAGRELARVRGQAGLTQARLAARLGISPSLVAHVERGARTLKPDLAQKCDELFATDGRFTRLCRDITTSFGSPLWFARWLDEIEPRATIFRSWDPLLVPGFLQTEQYARAVFRGHRKLPHDEIEKRVQARMLRNTLIDRDNPPEIWILMDEGVLHRNIGGRETMAEQLDHLSSVAERHNITLQVVPSDTTCTDGLLGAFTIAHMDDAPATVYVDSAGNGEVSTEHGLVSLIWGRYDRLRSEAYRPGDSLVKIKEAGERWTGTI